MNSRTRSLAPVDLRTKSLARGTTRPACSRLRAVETARRRGPRGEAATPPSNSEAPPAPPLTEPAGRVRLRSPFPRPRRVRRGGRLRPLRLRRFVGQLRLPLLSRLRLRCSDRRRQSQYSAERPKDAVLRCTLPGAELFAASRNTRFRTFRAGGPSLHARCRLHSASLPRSRRPRSCSGFRPARRTPHRAAARSSHPCSR